jgi:DNA end-binding protein Ku
MRGREHIAAIRAGGDVLILDTLLFAEDVRNPAEELRKLPEKTTARGKELEMAISLIDSMTEDWRPDDYHDTYNERVHKLIDDKKAGRKVSVEDEPAEPTKVVDLFDALSRSVETRRGKRRSSAPDLAKVTKADLERMARDLDIKGRSKMSRADLEQAVRDASPARRRAS